MDDDDDDDVTLVLFVSGRCLLHSSIDRTITAPNIYAPIMLHFQIASDHRCSEIAIDIVITLPVIMDA